MATLWTLLSHFEGSRTGHHQLGSNEHDTGSSLKIRRAHWGIETGLHYRSDVTFHEDATRMTVGDTGKVMASINNLVIALTRQAKFKNTAQAQTLVCCPCLRGFFTAHLTLFPTLVKPCAAT